MALPMLIVCLVIFILSLLSVRSFRKFDKHKLPPGPRKLPLIGNLHQLGQLPHRSFHKLSQKHGPLMHLKLGSIHTVVASSASTAKEFLKTGDNKFCNRPPLTSLGKFSYGFNDIAFSPYSEQWRELRKLFMAQLFSRKRVASFRSVREQEVERMISSISSRLHSCINLSEELLLLSNSVTCRSTLGKRYYEDAGSFGRILSETQALTTGFFYADYIPMLGWLDSFTGMNARLEKNFRELDDLFQKVIDEHLDVRRQDERGEDAIDTLLICMQKDTLHLTMDHFKAVLMNIFIGGTDSSSSLIEWTMAELMRNPEAMRKSQNEVRNVIGSDKERVEESDLDKLHYMKSVVQETLRLHPPGPVLLPRENTQHFKVDGYDIPAKTTVLINAYAIGRDENVWERADEFYPERFRNIPLDFEGQDFGFLPFGAGRRICPGRYSGMMVTELALANLLYAFDWELPKGMSKEDVDFGEALGITMHKKCALHLLANKFNL